MKRLACVLLLLAATLPAAAAVDRVDDFINTLDVRVPELLLRELVPSAAVAVVHNGRIVSRAWGMADLAKGHVATTQTRYNVASISKLLTTWGVMRLVEDGKIDLDAPVWKYVKRWHLPPSEQNESVTVRRLLSHSAGLSMAAVPQYAPGEMVPSIEQMLESDPPVRLIDRPGHAFHYSGGGFAVLQLLIEEISGLPYETYMQRRILEPLGMHNSTFVAPGQDDDKAAVPYDASLQRLPHYRFAALGAAGLYTTIDDLAVFAAATMSGRAGAPLSDESLAATMKQVATETPDAFGYGLGENLIALPSGRLTAGHSGSNDGWTSLLMTLPGSRDALVVLTNRSDAFPLYRDLMCPWLIAAAGENWPGFCGRRTLSWSRDDASFVDQLFAWASGKMPGASVLVAIGDTIVHQKAYGTTDPSKPAPITVETPFYVASLAKSLTAYAVLQLTAAGKMALPDLIGRYVSGLPEWAANATIEQLLSHTSGIPDYWSLIDWSTYDGIEDAGVITLLREKGKPLFPAGSRYAYSNSEYVLLAMAVERASGLSFNDYLHAHVLDPLRMTGTTVYDGRVPAPAGRAIGYSNEHGHVTLSDYLDVTMPNGKVYPFRATTVGAGGVFSTAGDLFRFAQTWEHPSPTLPLGDQLLAITPRTPIEGEIELPDTKGHGFGWFLSRRGKTNLVWNEGGRSGHKAIIVRVPDHDLTIVILSNYGEAHVNDIAIAIVDRLLTPKPAK